MNLLPTGTTLSIGDYIETIANPFISGITLNNNKKFEIDNITYRTLKDMRISYWQNQILDNPSLLNISSQKAMQKNADLDTQILNDALIMFNTIELSNNDRCYKYWYCSI